jgi:hypothetical protein
VHTTQIMLDAVSIIKEFGEALLWAVVIFLTLWWVPKLILAPFSYISKHYTVQQLLHHNRDMRSRDYLVVYFDLGFLTNLCFPGYLAAAEVVIRIILGALFAFVVIQQFEQDVVFLITILTSVSSGASSVWTVDTGPIKSYLRLRLFNTLNECEFVTLQTVIQSTQTKLERHIIIIKMTVNNIEALMVDSPSLTASNIATGRIVTVQNSDLFLQGMCIIRNGYCDVDEWALVLERTRQIMRKPVPLTYVSFDSLYSPDYLTQMSKNK